MIVADACFRNTLWSRYRCPALKHSVVSTYISTRSRNARVATDKKNLSLVGYFVGLVVSPRALIEAHGSWKRSRPKAASSAIGLTT